MPLAVQQENHALSSDSSSLLRGTKAQVRLAECVLCLSAHGGDAKMTHTTHTSN